MALGKYFYIRSKMNDMVLDVEGASMDPGTRVVMWPKKQEEEGNDNQLWYEDPLVGVIRSKLNGHCLDINDDQSVVVADYEDGRSTQQWITSGDRVQCRSNPELVFDVKEADEAEGTDVIAYEAHGGDNQRWAFDYTPPLYFYVVSGMNDKVLDNKHPEKGSGSKVIVKERDPEREDSQLWYEDRFGVLCNKKDNLVPDSSQENKIRLQVDEPGSTDQLWTIQENRIVNRVIPRMVLDISGKSHKEGAKVISYEWHGEENQTWRFEYT